MDGLLSCRGSPLKKECGGQALNLLVGYLAPRCSHASIPTAYSTEGNQTVGIAACPLSGLSPLHAAAAGALSVIALQVSLHWMTLRSFALRALFLMRRAGFSPAGYRPCAARSHRWVSPRVSRSRRRRCSCLKGEPSCPAVCSDRKGRCFADSPGGLGGANAGYPPLADSNRHPYLESRANPEGSRNAGVRHAAPRRASDPPAPPVSPPLNRRQCLR